MNILFISETFPDAAHPAQGTYNEALCRALAVRHRVRVVSPRPWIEALPHRLRGRRYETPEKVRASGIEALYPTHYYLPRVREWNYGQRMWQSVRRSVARHAAEGAFDAVLSYWAHPDGEAGLMAAQSLGIPSAVIVGGSDVLMLPKRKNRGACVTRVLTESSAVFTVSEGLRQAVIGLGIDPAKVHTTYQGVDGEVFCSGDQSEARKRVGLRETGARRLVWVGRMVPVKRVDLLIEAAHLLWQEGLRFSLHLVGDGPLRRQLQTRVSDLGLRECVFFEGAVSHARLPDWYRAADLVVLSSASEGLPNVLREAAACGTPFVSTDIGSIREIADPGFSRLVPPGSAPHLAKGIREALAPELRDAAQRYWPRSWANCARDIEEHFERLIGKRGTSDPSPKDGPEDTGSSGELALEHADIIR